MLGCFIELCNNGYRLCAQLPSIIHACVIEQSFASFTLCIPSVSQKKNLYSHQFLNKRVFTAMVM
jgi:hypothetical protein